MQTFVKPKSEAIGGTIVDSLSYSYKGMEVFQDLSFRAETKTVILRGPSGCGKTTLLKILSGNLTPSRISRMPPTEKSCLVLQEDSLFPWLSGIENIAIMTKIKPESFRRHAMFELISAFVEQKACRMSYGQRRLVELFRAIVFRPQFLYLDEPFNFLDEERIGLVLPFLQGEFMNDTNLMLSNHHREDLSGLGPATLFRFNGQFPVRQLRREQP